MKAEYVLPYKHQNITIEINLKDFTSVNVNHIVSFKVDNDTFVRTKPLVILFDQERDTTVIICAIMEDENA